MHQTPARSRQDDEFCTADALLAAPGENDSPGHLRHLIGANVNVQRVGVAVGLQVLRASVLLNAGRHDADDAKVIYEKIRDVKSVSDLFRGMRTNAGEAERERPSMPLCLAGLRLASSMICTRQQTDERRARALQRPHRITAILW